MAKLSDSEIGKHLAKFHGMKKGLVSFLTALEHWKRSEENRAELPTED